MDNADSLAAQGTADGPVVPPAARSAIVRWLLHDSPYIAMLVMALVVVAFHLNVLYWVILMPIFGVITGAEGWRNFADRNERIRALAVLALTWCAVLLAIMLLFGGAVEGVLTSNGSSLTAMILLGLGTFVAGLQARVWQICAVGGVLFLAVPGLGWLDQSPLLLTAATAAVVALGGFVWWVSRL